MFSFLFTSKAKPTPFAFSWITRHSSKLTVLSVLRKLDSCWWIIWMRKLGTNKDTAHFLSFYLELPYFLWLLAIRKKLKTCIKYLNSYLLQRTGRNVEALNYKRNNKKTDLNSFSVKNLQDLNEMRISVLCWKYLLHNFSIIKNIVCLKWSNLTYSFTWNVDFRSVLVEIYFINYLLYFGIIKKWIIWSSHI